MVLNGSYVAPVIVGRGSQATLNLGKINKQVSRRHAIVQWCNNSSAFQITVLGQNGVRINGVGYPSGQQATLREGDIVDLVGVKMLFRKPSGSPPLQEYLDSTFFEDDELIPMPSGLSTPKRAQNTDRAHQLATPNHSSPIQDSQLTPTARMRHKMLKYDDKDAESDHLSSSSRESSPESQAKKSPMDYTEMIIDTLVFARKKKSMTLSELFDEMIASQPSLMASQDPEEIKEQMLQCLSAARCVGRITRKGKDAYNKPLESQWYYIPECDHNVMRKQTRQEVMPSARKCTLKDKQYFFKMPPKLPYHRKSTSPYAVKASARRTKESSKLSIGGDDEAGEPSSSSSDLDDEVDESEQGTRKRKSANSGLVDKKRKGIVTNPARVEVQRNQDEEDEEDEDIHNDSLDDLSELSGLSD
ncbi:hypothetical protein EDD21DRAFT_300447 [Dissophora ornata]|nr:hypothetical protein EDD21DRAFT_300447 [Dissophora ornata]